MEIHKTINLFIRNKSEQWNHCFQVILCYSKLYITLEITLMLVNLMNFQQAMQEKNTENVHSLSLIANSLNLLQYL